MKIKLLLSLILLTFASVLNVQGQYLVDFEFLNWQVNNSICTDNPVGSDWVDGETSNNVSYVYLDDNYDWDTLDDDFLFLRSNFIADLNPNSSVKYLAKILRSNWNGATNVKMFRSPTDTNILQRMFWNVWPQNFSTPEPIPITSGSWTFNNPSYVFPEETYVRGLESDNYAILFEEPQTWVVWDPIIKKQVGIVYNYNYQFSRSDNWSQESRDYFYYSEPDWLNSWYGQDTLWGGSDLTAVLHPWNFVSTSWYTRNLPVLPWGRWTNSNRWGTWWGLVWPENALTFQTWASQQRSTCGIFQLHWCGDGSLDDNATTNFLNYNNILEQCDPGTTPGTWDDVFRAPYDAGGFSCADDCTIVQNPVCNSTSPNPWSWQYPDDQPLTVTCDTINNPNGIIWASNGVLTYTGSLNALWFGTLTIPANDLLIGDDWTVQCQDASGNVLQYANDTSDCDGIYDIVAAGSPACAAYGILSWVGQWLVFPVNSNIWPVCQYVDYEPVVPPDNLLLNWNPVSPLITVTWGGSWFIYYTWFFAVTPGTYSIQCFWNGVSNELCSADIFVIDNYIEKFQWTTWTLNSTFPAYWISNQQDGLAGTWFMPLNGFTRIFYRIHVEDAWMSSGTFDLVRDIMPLSADACYLDLTRTINAWSWPIWPHNPWDQVVWTITNDWPPAKDVEIVYYCDFSPNNQELTLTNTWYLDTTGPLFGPFRYDLISNTVAAQYVPSPNLNLLKTQATGWDSTNDPSWFNITNTQCSGCVSPGRLDITDANKIYYKLYTYNDWVDLDRVEIYDTFQFATGCQIENIVSNNTWSNTTPLAGFPAGYPITPLPTPLWSATDFLAWNEVSIIVSCDVPPTETIYQNQFTVTSTLSWTTIDDLSNIVESIRNPRALSILKSQRNDTSWLPLNWAFTFSGSTFTWNDVFTFQLYYQNTGLGTMDNVQIFDTFPTGFNLLSASQTPNFCNGAAPVFFPVNGVTDCQWDIWNIWPGMTWMITLTWVMSVDTTGYYYNTGTIYSSGIVFWESVVHQIPNILLDPAQLSLDKRQVSSTNSGFLSDCDPQDCQHRDLHVTVENNHWLSYQIEVTNHWDLPATQVEIYDLFPDGFVPITYTWGLGTYSASCVTPFSYVGSWQYELDCWLPILPSWGTVIIQVDWFVLTNSWLPGAWSDLDTYLNIASVLSPSDPNCIVHYQPGCNDTVVATVPGNPFLQLVKTFAQTTAGPWDIVQFTLLYYNLGTSTATGVYLTDVMPNGLTYISHTPASVVYSGWTFDLDPLYPNGFGPSANPWVPVIVQAYVDTGFTGTGITNTWYFCAFGLNCAVAEDDLDIVFSTWFNITKTAQDLSGNALTAVTSWQTFTYVIDFVNNGNILMSTYQIVDTLPATVTFVPWSFMATINGWITASAIPTIALPSLTWTCTNGSSTQLPWVCTLPAGWTWQITFDVTVN